MIYITSDHHFGHKNIIKYCNRPFKDVKEMDEVMVKNWNRVVDKNDIVYHLGDLVLASSEYAKSIIDRLNGYKIIILGNHDKSKKWYLNNGIDEIYKEYFLEGCILSHRPIETAGLNIHGHIHEKKLNLINKINVSVDVCNFTPIEFNILLRRKKYESQIRI